jgi:hypothetical protein
VPAHLADIAPDPVGSSWILVVSFVATLVVLALAAGIILLVVRSRRR